MPVSFAFGTPLHPEPHTDVHTATAELRQRMQQLVDQLQRDYPVDGTGQWWQPRHLGGTAPTPAEAAAADAARDAAREASARDASTRDASAG